MVSALKPEMLRTCLWFKKLGSLVTATRHIQMENPGASPLEGVRGHLWLWDCAGRVEEA